MTTLRNNFIFCLYLLVGLPLVMAQDTLPSTGITHSGLSTGQAPFPVGKYQELPNPIPTPQALWSEHPGTYVGWGDTHRRYKKEEPVPHGNLSDHLDLKAWKGEKISALWVVSAGEQDLNLSVRLSDLRLKGTRHRISKEQLQSSFVRYVMTDELNKDKKGACGHRLAKDFDSTLVADVIDHFPSHLSIPRKTSRTGWISIDIPKATPPGTYTGSVTILNGQKPLKELSLSVVVNNRVLPRPAQWDFHLDLWQNPYAAARYYQTPLWSQAHFQAMEKDYRMYSRAGGKSITASIIDRPWDGQTQDPFHSMVRWTRKLDGSWEFNFDVFDRWVTFMKGLGVTKQINTYSMIPWKLSFAYFDEASNTIKHLDTEPGEPLYQEVWVAMLKQFAAHLKAKGWFDHTYIAMDERPMEAMMETIKVIRKADTDFKISFAGSLHPELFDQVDDYCLSMEESFPEEILKKRTQEGKISTFYTSCAHAAPNSFTFSPPAQTKWYGWYAAKEGLDGYLRWAYNSWVLEPLLDSRFRTWAAGDTYLIYPGGRSSVRFEMLVEGIQAYEKIRILKTEFRKEGNHQRLEKLKSALTLFELDRLQDASADDIIRSAQNILNSL